MLELIADTSFTRFIFGSVLVGFALGVLAGVIQHTKGGPVAVIVEQQNDTGPMSLSDFGEACVTGFNEGWQRGVSDPYWGWRNQYTVTLRVVLGMLVGALIVLRWNWS